MVITYRHNLPQLESIPEGIESMLTRREQDVISSGPDYKVTMSSPLAIYLTEVLGVQGFNLPKPTDQHPFQYKVVFVVEKTLSNEAQQLFLRMTEAMKLSPRDYMLCVNEVSSDLNADLNVSYVVSFFPQWKNSLKAPVVYTDSPETLLRQPGLKKKVWTDLQMVMKQISIEDISSSP